MTAKTKTASKTAAKATAGAKETVEQVISASSDAMKDTFEKAARAQDELANLSRANFEAAVQSATAAAKGIEELNNEILSYSRQSIEDGIAIAKTAMTAKSAQELMDLQTEYARSAFDAYVGQVTKCGDMLTRTAKECFEPINKQATKLAELAQNTTRAA
jgi:phasin family protein